MISLDKQKTPAPSYEDFPLTRGIGAENQFDLVNQYGTYDVRRTAGPDNLYPSVPQELPVRRHKKDGKPPQRDVDSAV